MTSHQENTLKIIEFLQTIYRLTDEVNESFAINNDIGLAGMDADDFLEKFMEKFNGVGSLIEPQGRDGSI